MRSRVPSAELFTWKEKAEPFVDGKVHAKVAVVDWNQETAEQVAQFGRVAVDARDPHQLLEQVPRVAAEALWVGGVVSAVVLVAVVATLVGGHRAVEPGHTVEGPGVRRGTFDPAAPAEPGAPLGDTPRR